MNKVQLSANWALKGSPYEVQKQALKNQYKKSFGYLLDMGLGKSAVTYADFLYSVERGQVNALIVVCPNSLKENWQDQLEKWVPDHKNINFAVWPELPKKDSPPFIWIINYEAFYLGKAKAARLSLEATQKYKIMLVLDESITIKRHNGLPAKMMIGLSRYVTKKRILSGSPVTQGPHDLWSQLTFLGAINMNYWQFRHHFCIMGGYKMKQIVGAKNEKELNRLLTSCSYRATKDKWSDLPEKIYTTRQFDMTPKQKLAYKKMYNYFVVEINEQQISAQMVITQYGKLQQITSGFIIDEFKQVNVIENNPPKLKEIFNIMEQIEGKLLISVIFKYSMEFLTTKLKEFNPAILKGNMNTEDIREEKRKFSDDDSCRIVLCQPQSHKYGHTLLGSKKRRCCTEYFYENSYSLDDRKQIEDRIHRYGQDSDTVYIDPVCSPMDKKVITALQKKENVAKAIVDYVKKKTRTN